MTVRQQSTLPFLAVDPQNELKKKENISLDIGGLMKLITPFTILNQNLHEINLIRDAM